MVAVALVLVDVLINVVTAKVTAYPAVLVPLIQGYYLLFYSFFNTIYSNIFIMYRSFIWQGLYFVYL